VLDFGGAQIEVVEHELAAIVDAEPMNLAGSERLVVPQGMQHVV
jgi:hypothetical protein